MNKLHGTKKYIAFLVAALLLFTSLPVASGITASAAEGGDLMVTKVATSLSTVYADDPVYFYAVVRNIGSATVSAGSQVRIYRDGFVVEDVTITEDLAAGQMKTVRTQTTKPIFFGSHLVSAKLLPADGADSDSSNNYYRSRVIVLDENRPTDVEDPFDDPTYLPTTPGDMAGAPEPEEIPDTVYTKIEAETGTMNGASIASNHSGYTGSGFAAGFNSGASASYNYNADKAGAYIVRIKYANGNGAQNLNPNKNPTWVGATISSSLSSGTVSLKNSYEHLDERPLGETTGGSVWNSWRYTQTVIQLAQGENTITIKGNEGNKFNVDFLEIAPAQTAEGFKSFGFKMADNVVLDEEGGYVSGLKYDINCEIGDDGVITAKIPTTLDVTSLVASYTLANANDTVTVQGVDQISGISKNDFTNGQYYTVGNATFKVKLEYLEDSKLPNVFIRFERGEDRDPEDDEVKVATDETIDKLFTTTSKADKDGNEVQCYVTVEQGKESDIINPTTEKMAKDEKMYELPGLISVRGNSTLELEKKAYKVKLDKKAQLLDMSKSKHWIILASYGDKSMMRQYMGYELGRILNNQGLGYSPRTHYANTFIDGKYNGVYLLMESIKVASDRVAMISAEELWSEADGGEGYERFWDEKDIDETTGEQRVYMPTTTDTSGGYIIEFDARQGTDERDEDFVFNAAYGWYAVKESDVVQSQADAAAGYINDMNNAINSNNWNNVISKIDPYSFADWYIIMEIFKNLDAREYSSVYLTKVSDTEASIEGSPHYQADGKGRIYMGPIWDFDISSGNIDYGYNDVARSSKNTDGYYIKGGLWWDELFAYSEFKAIVRERYAYLVQQLNAEGGIGGKIQTTADYLQVPLTDNFEKWNIQTYAWPEPKIYDNYNGYVSDFKNWMTARFTWMTNQNWN